MILIIASEIDRAAQQLTERWAGSDAVLLTPKDLSMRGWSFRDGDNEHSTGVSGGKLFGVAELRGAVTRLPYVSEHELPHIMAGDRAYVAAEMHAFLLAWLSQLLCPVLNRPSVTSLAGPAWRQEKWSALSTRLGIPTKPVERNVDSRGTVAVRDKRISPGSLITVVGKQCIGTDNKQLATWSRALAKEAGADALSLEFTGEGSNSRFVSATPFLDVTDQEIMYAMSDYFGLTRTDEPLAKS